MITILFVFVNLITVNSIIQPTYEEYLKFNYLNCTNQTHSNTKTASLFHGVNLYNHTPYDYIIQQPELCKGKVDFVFYIQTALTHFSKRKLIRQTFGSLQWINGKRMVLLFVVGVHPGDKKSQKKLETESQKYRDIVQANFYDSYRNLTRKHLIMLNWISTFCSHAKFISKTDDDVYLNPYSLFATVYHGHFKHTKPFILGDIYYNERPLRSREKWRVTEEEYPKHLGLYPPFMKGYAYILSQAAIKPLWFCSYFRPYLFIDDLFITGLVVQSTRGHVKQHSLSKTPYKNTNHMSYQSATKLIDNYIFSIDNSFLAPLWKLAWKNSLRSSKIYDEF